MRHRGEIPYKQNLRINRWRRLFLHLFPIYFEIRSRLHDINHTIWFVRIVSWEIWECWTVDCRCFRTLRLVKSPENTTQLKNIARCKRHHISSYMGFFNIVILSWIRLEFAAKNDLQSHIEMWDRTAIYQGKVVINCDITSKFRTDLSCDNNLW